MHPALAQVDWEQESRAVVELLRALLRFDTTNPPGNEAECVAFLADTLRGAGVEPEVLTAAPGRANLVARLPGGDGGAAPLLLNGHVDVVAAEAGRWRHPPFAGEVHDGVIWGRGAVDMKQMVAMSVATVGLLARLGVPLRRDLKLAGVADEEAGCAFGSAWLVDHHPDKVRAGHALGEVGGATLYLGGRPFYPVQVAEKGIAWLRASATGATGHGSIPRGDNAVVRLSEFLARVGRRRLPLHPSPEARRFLEALAALQGRVGRAALPLLLHPRWSNLVLRRGVRDPGMARLLSAVLRNTASPTVVHAGSKVNVIPGQAEAELDGRIAVGSSEAELLAELRALAGPGIELELLAPSRPPTVTPPGDQLFEILAGVVAEHHPGAVAVPTVTPGFTDAKFWSQLGTACYGFAPARLEPGGPDFAAMFHGDDERLPVAGLQAGLRMLADAVARHCCR
jgi:acetylornithine deacetylase/succinyl-diaminopimelate desuccinylase-like protein